MSIDARSVTDGSVDERTVVGSVDETDSGVRFVVADVTADDAWLSVSESAARPLDEWC